MNKDYIFHVNWEDRLKKEYRVGILAQIDEAFYFILKGEKNAELAYKNGFIGISGFNAEEVYRSEEMFDFFKNRVLEEKQKSPCEELSKTRGISMTDSFSVMQVSEDVKNKYKQIILDAYRIQEKKKKAQIENNDSSKKVDSERLEDI